MDKIASVKIGPFYYVIEYVKDLHDQSEKLDGHVQHGQTRIRLDADLNPQAQTQTLLHEIVHVIATQIGVSNLKEEVVDAMAFSLYQVVRENPHLVKMINRKIG